jgi:hypothetical protein
MKKRSSRLIGLAGIMVFVLLAGAVTSYAQEDKRFGFGFGFNYYKGMDSRFTGNGNLFLLTFKLSDDFSVSILREQYKMGGSGVSTDGTKVEIDVDCAVTGLRLMRRISKMLDIGIDIGNASYSNGIEDSALMGGIIATITTIESRDKLFYSKLDIDLGYRIYNINHKDVFNNPKDPLTNLDSFLIGLNFKILF